jgi:hypothetical protein
MCIIRNFRFTTEFKKLPPRPRGNQKIEGRGATQAEAWHRACMQAEVLLPGVW